MRGPRATITPSSLPAFSAAPGPPAGASGRILAMVTLPLVAPEARAQIEVSRVDISASGAGARMLLGIAVAALSKRRRLGSPSGGDNTNDSLRRNPHGQPAVLTLLGVALAVGCGSPTQVTPGAGATAGAAGGDSSGTGGATASGGGSGTTGGNGSGGPVTGGADTSGAGTGGTAMGGSSTGGISTGGAAMGGSSTGGVSTGGAAMGGSSTGGVSTGGVGAGGVGAGEVSTGGVSAGGEGTGGFAAGGTGSGGADTGGSGGGKCEVAASCGTHKWACWPMPNPEGTGPNPASYTASDGVVHDNVTCLDWQESPSGTYTNSQAQSYCEGLSLGGYNDWRVPTRVELISIIDWTRSPTTDAAFSPQGGYHNTGSNWILTIQQRGAGTTCGNGDCAWMCNLSDGMCSNAYEASGAISVRCVRGNGAGEAFDEPAVAPPNQYSLISDDVAQDNYTRLIWQRDGAASGLLSWSDADSYCDQLSLGGYENWRLPTLRELSTLVDEATVAPAIDATVFVNTSYGARKPDKWYWASHQARGSSASWGINFDDGFTGFNSGSAAWNTFGPSWVKCVHDE